ncbi:MAG: leucine-rich repeat domain-containing protein, partial [Clostridia bacterium]|nr:leucine-rich repeat domain-containing protein [Clostridia bacterium]
ITLPNSLKFLGAKAFDFCSNLTEIKIPANVTEIGPSLFSGCYNLASVTVDSANPVYHGNGNCIIDRATKSLVAGCGASMIPADGSVTKIGEGAFYTNYRITQIVIPDGVTEICDYAFDSCLNLTEITIHASVTKIGNRALANCKDLTAVYYKGTTAQWDKIEKYEGGLNNGWNVYSEFTVYCSDGTV